MFRQLDKNAFNNFNLINYTSVRGNPIRNITADAFKNAEIKWLDLSHCLVRKRMSTLLMPEYRSHNGDTKSWLGGVLL